jgi:hypothetical protein
VLDAEKSALFGWVLRCGESRREVAGLTGG